MFPRRLIALLSALLLVLCNVAQAQAPLLIKKKLPVERPPITLEQLSKAPSKMYITGPLIQGSLLIIKTEPENRVHYLKRNVRVSPEGFYIIGIDRDAPRQIWVLINYSSGGETELPLNIKQRKYDIQRVEGVEEKYVTPSPEQQQQIDDDIAAAKQARENDDARTDFLQHFQWPAVGRISGVYGSQRYFNGEPRRPHYGVDIAVPVGTPVKAPAAGKITLVRDMYFSGTTVFLDHGHGLVSAFLHLSTAKVTVGQRVEQGEVIALSGKSGRATGPHLDWRMSWFDQYIDPQLMVAPMKQPQSASLNPPQPAIMAALN